MLEKICENNVWDELKSSPLPTVIYGMGNGAEKIISVLKEYGIKPSAIFASDEFVRGHSFLGYKIKKYSEICEEFDDFNIVLSFATQRSEVLEKIKNMNKEHRIFAPDVPVAGGGLFTREYISENEREFDKAYSLLKDEKSKSDYVKILNFKVSGKVDYLFDSFCCKSTVYTDILKLKDDEIIFDLGAYDGDTIREITAACGGKYKSITALEPDLKNFKKLLKNTKGMANITALNMGAWSKKESLIFDSSAGRNSHISSSGILTEVTDIDSIAKNGATLIKMDIEGSEMKALCGAEKTIKKYLPKLYICAYHRNEDLFAIPLKINSLSEKYEIYFRHSPYIPAWESNFYALCGE